jgi:ABC-type uncharacterized transport system auxiliary subunit
MKLSRLLIILLSTLLFAGCVNLPQRTPLNRTNYMLKATPPAADKSPANTVIMLNNATIIPQYASSYFIYQTGPSTYRTDYYHKFFIPPSLIITQIMQSWLSQSFNQVIPNTSMIMPDYIVQPNITALYANTQTSQAVMSVQVMLLKRNSISQNLVSQRTFTASNPFVKNNSQSLVDAWNKDLAEILTKAVRLLEVQINTGQSPVY